MDRIIAHIPARLLRSLFWTRRLLIHALTLLFSPLRLIGFHINRWGPARGIHYSVINGEIIWSEKWSARCGGFVDQRLTKTIEKHSKQQSFLMSIARLENAHAFGPDGSVVDKHGNVVKEYSRQVGQDIKIHRLLRTLRLPIATYFNGTIGVLNVNRSDNYYHWLFEVLPRLHALQISTAPPSFYYVSARTRFQRESLNLAGIGTEQIIDPVEHPHVLADCLLVPSLPPLGFPTPQSIAYLRELTAKAIDAEPKGGPKRIYVSRQRGTRRRLLNPDPVEMMLHENGFETIYCEDLNFTRQATLFAGAEFVVGIHGAGLSNLAFCKPGTRVLELFAPNWINLCYRSLAIAAELHYNCLVGEGGGLEQLGQGAHGRSSLTIDPYKLLQHLQELNQPTNATHYTDT